MTRLVVPVLLLATGCTAEMPEEAAAREAIVGGMIEPGEDAVVLVLPFAGVSRCTGTLITDRVVLTAKHCVQAPGADGPYVPSTITIGVGPRLGAHTEYPVHRLVTTPGSYTAGPTGLGGSLVGQDVGVIMLREAIPGVTPIPVRRTPPTDLVGRDFTAIGYGQRPDGSSGVKYQTTGSVTGITGNVIFGAMTICSGDSGGPIIEEGTDRRVFGVASFGEAEACPSRQDGWNRVDPYLGLIDGAIYATGGCPEMRSETCNSVDDDCNGEVDEGCTALGGTCAADEDCAFAQLPAWFEPLENPVHCADTSAGRVCTRSCDPLEARASCGTTELPFLETEVANTNVYCGRTTGCEGTCLPGSPGTKIDGDDCAANTECVSLSCIDPGDGSAECASPCRVDTGACVEGDLCVGLAGADGCGGCIGADRISGGGRGLGEVCGAGGDCRSGQCWEEAGSSYCTRACTADTDCGSTAFHCRVEDSVCIRGERAPSGSPCLRSGDCVVGEFCSDDSGGWCTHGCSVDTACPDGYACGTVMGSGACVAAGDRARLGAHCRADAECLDRGRCASGTCVRDCGPGAPCPTGFACEREDDGIGAVCRSPRRGGGDEGCAVGAGRAGGAAGWILALVAMLACVRRRRC